MCKNKKTSGFTLIELLVVIAIISLLSSVVMSSVASARMKSRNTTRMTTLKSLQTALEMYFNDNSGYPSTGGAWWGVSTYGGHGRGATGYIPGLVPTYIAILPIDPRGLTVADGYLYRSDGVNYKLLNHRSIEGPWNSTFAFYDPLRPTWAWQVSSSQAVRSGW
jgi:general secretion pathway protein G